MLTRIFLALMALMFAAFGLYSLLNPVQMASGLGVEVGGPNGAYELRGIYGGVSLAAGLRRFCALPSSFRQRLDYPRLIVSAQ